MEDLNQSPPLIQKFIAAKQVKKEEILEYKLEDQFENINVDYRNSNYKLIKFNFDELKDSIYLIQDFSLGKGGIFWDGSCVLLKSMLEYLLTNRSFAFLDDEKLIKYMDPNFPSENKNQKIKILELGSGLALPSLFFSKFKNFEVTATDIKRLIPIVNTIKDLNFDKEEESYDNFKIKELSWDKKEDVEKLKKESNTDKFDVIIGSELVYSEEYLDDLINVLKEFSGELEFNKKTAIFLSFKIRLPELTQGFLDNFSLDFHFEYIEEEIVKKYYPNPQKLKIIYAYRK